MPRTTLLPLLLLAASAGPALGQTAPAEPANILAGRTLAQELCSACHLTGPEDRGPVPDGVPTFMAIGAEPGQTEAALTARLFHEHPLMPQPPLTQEQAADVVAYILSLRPEGEGEAVPP
ncbi:MAG TPA: cytochrome c [Geminicoccaceae bacterium]|nr:cytochrome c [Geminicoccaceae bacterium]